MNDKFFIFLRHLTNKIFSTYYIKTTSFPVLIYTPYCAFIIIIYFTYYFVMKYEIYIKVIATRGN